MGNEERSGPTKESVAACAELIGLKASKEELEGLLPILEEQGRYLTVLRSLKVDKTVEPDVVFSPEEG